jgi:hypothetical protein
MGGPRPVADLRDRCKTFRYGGHSVAEFSAQYHLTGSLPISEKLAMATISSSQTVQASYAMMLGERLVRARVQGSRRSTFAVLALLRERPRLEERFNPRSVGALPVWKYP